jgi:hypothetical protein
MRRASSLLAVALLVASCDDVPPVVQPTPPVVPSIPSRITVTATPGVGTAAGEVYVSARVFDAQGRGVGSTPVSFSVNVGTVSPAAAVADPGGLAQTTVKTTGPTTVRVAAGPALATMDVTPNPSITQPGPPVPTPTPPNPTPNPPSSPLTVTINAAPAPAGSPTTFGLAMSGGVSSATWAFGDGGSETTGTSSTAHVYTSAGTYTVSVSVIDQQNRSASASTAVTIKPSSTDTPPPAATVNLTLTCTIAAHGSPTTCNLAASYGGVPLQSTPPTFVQVDWDFGDGQSQIVTGPPLVSHTYTQVGTYLIAPHATVTIPDGSLRIATTSQALKIP